MAMAAAVKARVWVLPVRRGVIAVTVAVKALILSLERLVVVKVMEAAVVMVRVHLVRTTEAVQEIELTTLVDDKTDGRSHECGSGQRVACKEEHAL